MSIERTVFDDINESDLAELLTNGVPEGLTIEYKRDPFGTSDAEKKEALKDITSFANSNGGHLVIGIDEQGGVPTGLPGLPNVNTDDLINRLESLIRDGVEPRLIGVRIKSVVVTGKAPALVIRIPKSWNPPHRVSAAKSNRFYVRNSGGVHEASVEELRVLFTLSADVQQRIRAFRAQRIEIIRAGEGPVPLAGEGRLVLHVVPLSAFGQANSIDLAQANESEAAFAPLGEGGRSPRFNLDGFIVSRGGDAREAYTQLFRNGIIEAAKAKLLGEWKGKTVLYRENAAGVIVSALPTYFAGLYDLGVSPPFVVMVSYLGIGGSFLAVKGYDNRLDRIEPFPPIDPILLPEIIINEPGTPDDYARALRPIFDALWNAAGFVRCLYYDEEGGWAGSD